MPVLAPRDLSPGSSSQLKWFMTCAMCHTTGPAIVHIALSTAFGLLKGNTGNTASLAVKLVSDQDFSLLKTFHIINFVPPPAEVS
ncbi:hypothetical protein QBC35DRAFT_448210 [Podospora australis]|uniref:Uncharacterized protein n=1 Tax=Podospora australis TaxID=1536484 RepID=A0AAN7ANA0_9PEZI|nr:hypothetical protein QBC35DRAFT_448210 [Podospora australis]